jgi:hypothetical protein
MNNTSRYEFSLPFCSEEQQLQVQKALMLPGAITTATVNRSTGSAGVTVQATFLPTQSLALMQAEIIARIAPIGLLPVRTPG